VLLHLALQVIFFFLITFTIKKKVDYKEVSDESEGFCKDEKPSK